MASYHLHLILTNLQPKQVFLFFSISLSPISFQFDDIFAFEANQHFHVYFDSLFFLSAPSPFSLTTSLLLKQTSIFISTVSFPPFSPISFQFGFVLALASNHFQFDSFLLLAPSPFSLTTLLPLKQTSIFISTLILFSFSQPHLLSV